jgi:hypothetical protein
LPSNLCSMKALAAVCCARWIFSSKSWNSS